ncbi:hypothetical protein J4466_05225 [Candidatus Pacearchaeota archaeon]|nr:hypothetical protein [Candidatus Pacearchaeota archaeon]
MDIIPNFLSKRRKHLALLTDKLGNFFHMPRFHRFRFEISYGNMNSDEFEQKGNSVFYQTETLPMI